MQRIREAVVGDPPALAIAAWTEAFPWLVHGTTLRWRAGELFDLGLHGDGSPLDDLRRNWSTLRAAAGADRVVHARQVHGDVVRLHGAPRPDAEPGDPHLVDDCDGHATDEPGALLAVTTADCVPVFVVDPPHRAVGVLHAGWRGAAAGILERGLAAMAEGFGTRAQDARLHLGPAICGRCYEVGPEVFEALGEPPPLSPAPLDLREALARRAGLRGVPRSSITISEHCTRCTDSGLFSHRGGDPHRQAGFIGVRTR